MDFDKLSLVSVGKGRFISNEKGEPLPILGEIRKITPISGDENLFLYYADYFLNCGSSLIQVIRASDGSFEYGNVPALLFLKGLELKAKGKLFTINNFRLDYGEFGKRYGHDLNTLMEALKSNGVNWDNNLDANELTQIVKIGQDYKNKLYDYAEGIDPSNPLIVDPLKIEEITSKILKNIQ